MININIKGKTSESFCFIVVVVFFFNKTLAQSIFWSFFFFLVERIESH